MAFDQMSPETFSWDSKVIKEASELLHYASFTADKRGRPVADLLLTSLWMLLHPKDGNAGPEGRRQDRHCCCCPCQQRHAASRFGTGSGSCPTTQDSSDSRSESPPILLQESQADGNLEQDDSVLSLTVESADDDEEEDEVIEQAEQEDDDDAIASLKIVSVSSGRSMNLDEKLDGDQFSMHQTTATTGLESLKSSEVEGRHIPAGDRKQCHVSVGNFDSGTYIVPMYSSNGTENDTSELDQPLSRDDISCSVSFQPHVTMPQTALAGSANSSASGLYIASFDQQQVLTTRTDSTGMAAVPQTYMYLSPRQQTSSTLSTPFTCPSTVPSQLTVATSRSTPGYVQLATDQSLHQAQVTPVGLLPNLHNSSEVNPALGGELASVFIKQEPVDFEENNVQPMMQSNSQDGDPVEKTPRQFLKGTRENILFMEEIRNARGSYIEKNGTINFHKLRLTLRKIVAAYPELQQFQDDIAMKLLRDDYHLFLSYRDWLDSMEAGQEAGEQSRPRIMCQLEKQTKKKKVTKFQGQYLEYLHVGAKPKHKGEKKKSKSNSEASSDSGKKKVNKKLVLAKSKIGQKKNNLLKKSKQKLAAAQPDVKRKRGRPRKHPLKETHDKKTPVPKVPADKLHVQKTQVQKPSVEKSQTDVKEEKPLAEERSNEKQQHKECPMEEPRKRGRPRKHPKPSDSQLKSKDSKAFRLKNTATKWKGNKQKTVDVLLKKAKKQNKPLKLKERLSELKDLIVTEERGAKAAAQARLTRLSFFTSDTKKT